MGTIATFRMRDVFTTVQRCVKDPFAWSAIGSLGLHVLIFGTFPIFASSPAREREAEIKGAVNVVELTPEEQQRIPDIALTPPDLPPLPDFANPNALNAPLAVPPSGSFFAAPPPQPIFIPAPQSTMLPSIGFSNPYTIQPPPVRSSITIPVPNSPTTPAAPPRLAPSNPQPANSTPANSTPANATPANNTTPTSPTNPANSSNPATPANPANANSPNPANATPAPNIAQVQQQRMAQLKEEQRVERERFAIFNSFDAAGTDATTDGNVKAGNWLNLISKTLDDLKTLPLSREMPEPACKIQESRIAVVGVLVDRTGKVIDRPGFNQVLVSSGYAFLNEFALAEAKANAYGEQTADRTPYTVTVTLTPRNACPRPVTAPTPAPAT